MTAAEIPLAMAERHVRQFEAQVAQQEELVKKLRDAGRNHELVAGDTTLAGFRRTLETAREHLRIERERAARHG